MPRVDYFERLVSMVEGFNISICNGDGANIRGDKEIPNTYTYQRMAKNSWTVSEWITARFLPLLAGFTVQVMKADGNVAHGSTLLATVRDSYATD